MPEHNTPNPIIFVVDDDPVVVNRVCADLERRFGRDFRIEADHDPEPSLDRLTTWAEAGEEVALVIAELWLPGMTGIDFLVRAREVQPSAQRAVLVDYGDQSSSWPLMRATTLGQVDFRIIKPWRSPEEWLYEQVSDALALWWRQHRRTFAAVQVIGDQWLPRCHGLRDILERNPIPYAFVPADDPEGERLVTKHGLTEEQLPAAILWDGRVLTDPSDVELAEALGVRTVPSRERYDLAVIGAGPAGLAAAVYAASEGLRTILIERTAVGGQAGSSAMIRNYPGFPYGISGSDLTARAYEQARLFGTDAIFMRAAEAVEARGEDRVVHLSDDAGEVVARAVLIATGVTGRGIGVEKLDRLYGAGVFYGSAAAEAPALQGDEVFVVGAGNSAGQAAQHLARYAERVTLIARGASLEESMSEYLISAIGCMENIAVRTRTRIVDAAGRKRLAGLTLEHLDSGERQAVPASALFVLIGADPHTDWLTNHIRLDKQGYVLTGRDVPPDAWSLERPPMPLETCLPGVFAAGDVRCGSTKRASAAVGEGAAVVGYVHHYLTEASAIVPT